MGACGSTARRAPHGIHYERRAANHRPGGAVPEDSLRKLCDKQTPPMVYAAKTDIDSFTQRNCRISNFEFSYLKLF